MEDEKGPYKDYMVQKHMNNGLERDGRCTESRTIEENSSNIDDDFYVDYPQTAEYIYFFTKAIITPLPLIVLCLSFFTIYALATASISRCTQDLPLELAQCFDNAP